MAADDTSTGSSLADAAAGRFDPDATLADLPRAALAELAREYLLIGHLSDRVSMPLLVEFYGSQVQTELAIDEWMAASPIYSRRMQAALGFEDRGVETVFKNIQLDIGAPPQFMDFRFRLDSAEYGEFWLDHCGALMDVEPWGDTAVTRMCHDIEDPTFDATAAATDPRMVMRPIHRPPRTPTDRHPHCRWKVFLDEDNEPAEPHANLGRNAASLIAGVALDETAPGDDHGDTDGLGDYAGPLDPDLQLEDFSHHALAVIAQEAAVQAHLLTRSLLLEVEARSGADDALKLARRHWIGTAALGAYRLRTALGLDGRDDIEALARIVQLHPHFLPRTYVDLHVDVLDDRTASMTIGPSPALGEGDACTWFAELGHTAHPALDALVAMVNPRARCTADPSADDVLRWTILIDAEAEARAEPPEFTAARLSTGTDFRFEDRTNLSGNIEQPVALRPTGD